MFKVQGERIYNNFYLRYREEDVVREALKEMEKGG
jgi:hypothetical protein